VRLTYRLASWLVAGNCVVLGVYGHFAVRREEQSFERAMEREAQSAARTLLALLEDVRGPDAAAQLCARATEPGGLEFRWLPGVALPAPRFERASGRLRLATPFSPAGGALEVSRPLAADEEYVQASLRRLYLVTGGSAALSTALAVLLSRRLVGEPVAALLARVQRVGGGAPSNAPSGPARGDELGALASALDAVARDLEATRERAAREEAQREAATRQLRHAERLATVGRLASGVAHELGTPLNVLLARASLIARADVPDAVRKNAEVIREQVQRMSRTIRQLLDLSRRSEPRRARLDLRELAAKTIGVLAPLAEQRRVPLVLGEGPGSAWAHVDPEQLGQVLTNLLVNAIQATGDRQQPVRVDLERVEAVPPQELTARPCWRLAVRDRGCGIPDELRQRIFEPFFTTKEVGEGTGLGLTVAHGIVAEHDGWITVESEVGAGSEFAVLLPAEEAA
jgi:two-component system NtrC family sensor kinase